MLLIIYSFSHSCLITIFTLPPLIQSYWQVMMHLSWTILFFKLFVTSTILRYCFHLFCVYCVCCKQNMSFKSRFNVLLILSKPRINCALKEMKSFQQTNKTLACTLRANKRLLPWGEWQYKQMTAAVRWMTMQTNNCWTCKQVPRGQ